MNLVCVICADSINQNSDVFITSCGHMFHHHCLEQWLERSKSCPQCRARCSSGTTHRVYFNVAQDASVLDTSSLLQQLEDANLKSQNSSKELQQALNQIENLKAVSRKSMKTVSGLEEELSKNKFLIYSYNEQIKTLKASNKILVEQQKEMNELREQHKLLKTVQDVMAATSEDVESMLKEVQSIKTLAVLVSALKRELRICDGVKTELRNSLSGAQNDLRRERKEKESLKEKIVELESANYLLTEKKRLLRDAIKLQSKNENYPSRLSLGSVSQEPVKPSPGIHERVKLIEESKSPYLNIRSSSIGLSNLLKQSSNIRNKNEVSKSNESLGQKYTILKKPRLDVGTTAARRINETFVYDGTGISKKHDLCDYYQSKRDSEPFNRAVIKSSSLSDRVKSGQLKRCATTPLDNFIVKLD